MNTPKSAAVELLRYFIGLGAYWRCQYIYRMVLRAQGMALGYLVP